MSSLQTSFFLLFLVLVASVVKGQDIIDRNGRYTQRYYFIKPDCNFDNLLEFELYSADKCSFSGQYQTSAQCFSDNTFMIGTNCEHACSECVFQRKFPFGCFNNANGTSVLQTCGQLVYNVPYNGLFWNVKYETNDVSSKCDSMYYSRVRRVGLCGTISKDIKPSLVACGPFNYNEAFYDNDQCDSIVDHSISGFIGKCKLNQQFYCT